MNNITARALIVAMLVAVITCWIILKRKWGLSGTLAYVVGTVFFILGFGTLLYTITWITTGSF